MNSLPSMKVPVVRTTVRALIELPRSVRTPAMRRCSPPETRIISDSIHKNGQVRLRFESLAGHGGIQGLIGLGAREPAPQRPRD
jgi:hypothetical protein